MIKSLSITIFCLCGLLATLALAEDASTVSPNTNSSPAPSQNGQPQNLREQGQGFLPNNPMQNMIPNANQMGNMIPNQMQQMIPNQMQDMFSNPMGNMIPNQMQNMMPNGNQMPWNNMPYNPNNGQQMNPNQIGGALTNMLNRGMSLIQAFRQLMGSLRNGGQNNGQTMPNLPFGMNQSNFGNNMQRQTGPLNLNGLTGPLDGVVSQTGLPIQIGQITNPLSQTLNGLLNPGNLLPRRR